MIRTESGRRVVLIGLVAIIAAMLPLSGASAAHLTGVTQLVGDTNIDAAIAWSDPGAFPDGGLASGARDPEYVLIGRDDIFPDNLASGALQGAEGPLLLTDTDSLGGDVVDEIERLGVDEAIILGGVNAISDDVEDQLEDLVTTVSRLEGPTRIETAIEVTQANADDTDTAPTDPTDTDDGSTAILARAFDASGGSDSAAFADSLAAGGWAAEAGYGVLLTQTDTLTESVAEFLEGDDIDSVIIVGGTEAVSDEVEDAVEQLGLDVERVGGSNRAATAVAIADRREDDAGEESGGYILTEGYTDDAWASGFPAAATSALEGYPIVLANGEELPPETDELASDIDSGTDMDTATDGSENVDVVCGPLLEGAGAENGDSNTTDDLAPACEDFAGEARSETTIMGTVTEADTGANTFDIVSTEDDPEVAQTVTYDDDDTFTVDDEDASLEEFEAALTPGDEATVTEAATGEKTIDLTNGELTDEDCLTIELPIIGCPI